MVAVAETVAHLRQRATESTARSAERDKLLRAALPRARDILRRHGAASVVLFGSVAEGRTTPSSDLDLAAVGLPGEAYFPALGELMAELPCDVDLVRLEEASPSLRDRILSEGVEL